MVLGYHIEPPASVSLNRTLGSKPLVCLIMHKTPGTVGASIHYQMRVFSSSHQDSACISFTFICLQTRHRRATGERIPSMTVPADESNSTEECWGEVLKFAKGIMTSAKRPWREEKPRTRGCGGGEMEGEGGWGALVSLSSGPRILGKQCTSEVQVCLFLAKCNRLFLREKSLKGL